METTRNGTASAPALPTLTRIGDFLAAEGMLVAICGLYLILWSLLATWGVQSDTWLTLLGGREIGQHGIPHGDALAIVTHGREWVDQQWLGQVLIWQIHRVGGMALVSVVAMVLLLSPIALAMRIARRRGASVPAIAPFAAVPILAFGAFLRVEIFSRALFVPLLALLAAESRSRSRRVWLAFPLLVVWANLHGAVVVGAGLVALLGACELVKRRTVRGFALLVLPWACLFATPYGLATIGYYHSTIGNPVFHQAISEWMPPTFPSPGGLTLGVLGVAALFLVTRRHRELSGFEKGALAFTLVGALLANRSIPWFAYACLAFLPALVDDQPAARRRRRRLAIGVAVTCAAGGVAGILATAAAPESRLTVHWHPGAVAAVERVMRSDPHARIFPSYDIGDWLLYEDPSLKGRIAFDGRWEVLSPTQARNVLNYLWQIGADWEAPSRGYRLLVLNPGFEPLLVKTYRRRHVRELFRSKQVVVFDRGPAADG
jgi:hypothetical protein